MRIWGQTIPFCAKCHIIEFNVNEKPNKVSKCSRNKLKKEKKDMKRVCIKLLHKNITYPYPIFCCFLFLSLFFFFFLISQNYRKFIIEEKKRKKKFYICTLVTLLYLKLLSIIILTKQQVDLHLIVSLKYKLP